MDLQPILNKVDAVRSRVRSLVVLDGLSRILLIALACAAAMFLIDYSVPKVPIQVRWTLLAASLATIGLASWRYLFYPLGVRISDDEVISSVERQYPDLNDRLISALQLQREGGRFANFNSPELVDALVREALRDSQSLDFGPVIVSAGPRKIAGIAAGVLVVAGLLGAWQSDLVRIWALRLLSDTPWPRKTTIVVLSPASNPVTVAKGDDLDVEIETQGARPRKAIIWYRFSGTGQPIQRPMKGDDHGKFRFQFSKIIEPLEFWIEAGDHETEPFGVAVLSPPAIERISALYRYPKYTRLPDTDPATPVEDGNIVAPIGTRVLLTAQANLEIQSARIMFGSRSEEEVRDLEVRMDAEGKPRVIYAEIDVVKNTNYAIWMQATNGLRTQNPVRYSIKATEDKAPEIRVSEPNMDKFATPQAEIPIRFASNDDFGVTSLVLHVRVSNDPKRPEQMIALDPFNTESYPAKRQDTDYPFKMPEFQAKEGLVIQYQIIAKDGREAPGPNETKTRVYQFTIISRDAMLKKMEEMIARIREELLRIIAFQESGRVEVARLMDALKNKDTLEVIERQAVNAAGGNQRRITQHLERVLREFDEIVRDMRYNKLFEGQAEVKLRKPGDLLKLVTDTKSPETSLLIQQAASVVQAEDRQSRLTDAAVRQEEITVDLYTVLALLTEYETYMEVVRTLKELIKKAEMNLKDLQGLK